ncbi:MAG TPA: hypothetical protein VMB71_01905 [Acetobacteraceae bacterium]|nr:hypothetical protein [Acetobacteraceae bacterium]
MARLTLRRNPAWFASAAAAMLACTWMGPEGAPTVFRHVVLPVFTGAALLLFAMRAAQLRARMAEWPPALLALVLFLILVGAGGVANHGAIFAAMAGDFWHASLLLAPDRRPALPALAYSLPPWPAPYVAVWYAAFAALFVAAWLHLTDRGLPPIARFAVLTGSIAAYLLIIPGYSEALTFLVALLCWRADMTAAEKCVAAALMIGGHEVAAGFALIFLAIEAAPADRRQWLCVAAFLYVFYAAGYVLSARAGLVGVLGTAMQPAAGVQMSAFVLDLQHPLRCLLGITAAYKLLWLLLPCAWRVGGRARLHMLTVLAALPLVLVAIDTSRIVQFGSLSMFACATAAWPTLAVPRRRIFTAGMLLLPSICAGTLRMPAWGKGLYAIYLFVAQKAGFTLGGVAF